MKKIGVFLLCGMFLFTMSGCSGNEGDTDIQNTENVPSKESEKRGTDIQNTEKVSTEESEETEKDTSSPNCEDFLTILKDGGVPIIYSIIYDENTDPNILANGKDVELSYLQKANFADERIEKDYDQLQPRSGTIEVFSSPKEAVNRATLLDEMTEKDKYPYRIITDNILVRLSKDYTKEQAQEIAQIVNGEIHSLGREIELKDKFGDMLDAYQGEWKSTVKTSPWRVIINNDEINFVCYEDGEVTYIEKYHFDLDDNGNLITERGSYSPQTVTMDDSGKMIMADTLITNTYKKISDNTTVPNGPEEKERPAIGMSGAEVCHSTWGSPKKINTTTTAAGEREQWVYENGYIYFENGYVTSIQEK